MKSWKQYLAILLLCGVVFLLFKQVVKLQSEVRRKDSNIEAFAQEINHFRTKEGILVAQSRAFEMTAKEFKSLFEEEAQKAKDLGLKVKRIETYMESHMVSRDSISTGLRDTIIIVNSDPVLSKTFTYQDQFMRMRGVVAKDSVGIDYSHRTKINQIIYRVPKRFLFIKYGTKYLEQYISSENPKDSIEYTRIIKPVKKGKRAK